MHELFDNIYQIFNRHDKYNNNHANEYNRSFHSKVERINNQNEYNWYLHREVENTYDQNEYNYYLYREVEKLIIRTDTIQLVFPQG